MFPSQERIQSQIAHLLKVHQESEANIRPHFFLTGPSGTGKSFLVKKLCEDMDIPHFTMNAASITSEGVSGNSLSKALRPLREMWNKPNVIFVDEFDKLFQRNGESTEGFRNQVQDEFLHILEAENASVFGEYGKYDPVKIDNSMFIFAGAFHGSKIDSLEELQKAGMRTEFVGRVPLVFCTQVVSLAELRVALPNIKLFKDYLILYPKTNKQKAIKEICLMLEEQMRKMDIGIRLLNSVVHQYFMRDI